MEKSASLRVTRRRKKISDDRSTTNSDLLSIDVIMEILKRLPVKTLVRFLCVSKLWASIIRRRDFMKLFLTASSTRPGSLFFSFMSRMQDCFFFSSLQTQNPGEVSLATYHLTHPPNKHGSYYSCGQGLICYGTACASGLVVYNSSTRRSITLPSFKPGSIVNKHFLGYDAIDGIYKVLCITRPDSLSEPVFQVLTLGNESSWKIIENSHNHYPWNSQISISGVIYYEAYADTEGNENAVMSFDVRSEKFDFIKGPGDFLLTSFSTMIKYEGKLAFMSREISANGSMVLWVLEDAVKPEWLKKVFVLPNSWTSLAWDTSASSHKFHSLVNVTDAGELILAPIFLGDATYYVLYYDPKRNSVRKVEIEGITLKGEIEGITLKVEERQDLFLYLFSSQVESLMFL